MKKYLYLIAAIAATPLFGKIEMPKVFSNYMVLQRNANVNVWGTAEPNATVEVQFKGQKKSTKADDKGKWSVRLDKMPADKTPRQMTVFENGEQGKQFGNVLVGEVWVLGGQSNMAWTVSGSTGAKEALERAAANKNIRYFWQSPSAMARNPRKDSPNNAHWETGKNAGHWSGVGNFFAEKNNAKLGVPVGLVFAAQGATEMSCWVEKSAALKNPAMKKIWEDFQKEAANYDEAAYQKACADYKKFAADLAAENAQRKAKGQKEKKMPWDKKEPNKISPRPDFRSPVYKYNAMVSPLRGYTVRGAIWYQGESDTKEPNATHFESQMKHLVSEWRKYFDAPEMPFIMAQLSSYSYGNEGWVKARAAQLKTANDVENVFTIPTIDKGMKLDIHPKDKTTVGVRMANMALSQVYGKKSIKPFAPQFKSAKYDGDTATVRLETYGVPLSLKGKERGFEVRANGKWSEAQAKLASGKLLVKSKDGAKVDGVRYLWKAYPQEEICIYNTEGLPLFPFSNEK